MGLCLGFMFGVCWVLVFLLLARNVGKQKCVFCGHYALPFFLYF